MIMEKIIRSLAAKKGILFTILSLVIWGQVTQYAYAQKESKYTIGKTYQELSTNQEIDVSSVDNQHVIDYILLKLEYEQPETKSTQDVWSAQLTLQIKDSDGNLIGDAKILKLKGGNATVGTEEQIYVHQEKIDINQLQAYKVVVVDKIGDNAPDQNIRLKIINHQKLMVNMTAGTLIDKHNLSLKIDDTPTGNSNSAGGCKQADGQNLLLSWDYVQGAFGYQVEYTWVDYYDGRIPDTHKENEFWTGEPSDDFDPFKEGVTVKLRVSNENQGVKIPLTYPKGVLAFRVRAVGRDITSDELILGEWTDQGKVHHPSGTATDTKLIWRIGDGFEADKNWMWTRGFTEDGKHKLVIQYADESLRPQQTITHLNSSVHNKAQDPITIVQENMYDYEGRTAINILPVPAKVCQNAYDYKPGFNQWEGSPNERMAYDADGDFAKLDITLGGAAEYYSAKNKFDKTNAEEINWIPDAEGYPFTHTIFDTRGRIKFQGGLGKAFQPTNEQGGDHVMATYYTDVTRSELTKLFGTQNIGEATHYRKIIHISPEGQKSVTYTDLAGKTIATALLGDKPEQVTPLDSYKESKVTNLEILEGRTLVGKNGEREASYTFYNAVPNTNYNLNYEFDKQDLLGLPSCAEGKCGYELTIEIVHEESADHVVLDNPEPIYQQRFTINRGSTMPIQRKLSFNLEEPGTYILRKTLRLMTDVETVYSCIESEANNTINRPGGLLEKYEQLNTTDGRCELCEEETVEACLYTEENINFINNTIEEGSENECKQILSDIQNQIDECNLNIDPTQHPEYIHYQICQEYQPSKVFDRKVQLGTIPLENFDDLANDPIITSKGGINNVKSQVLSQLAEAIKTIDPNASPVDGVQARAEQFIKILQQQPDSEIEDSQIVELATQRWLTIYTTIKNGWFEDDLNGFHAQATVKCQNPYCQESDDFTDAFFTDECVSPTVLESANDPMSSMPQEVQDVANGSGNDENTDWDNINAQWLPHARLPKRWRI